jgi:hypothetical protein
MPYRAAEISNRVQRAVEAGRTSLGQDRGPSVA